MPPQTNRDPVPVVSLPVVRFSWVTFASDSQRDLPWSHKQEVNMYLVFDNVSFGFPTPQVPRGKLLKVVQDNTVLESIELEHLSRLANDEREKAMTHNQIITGSQLPISSTVRSPKIALTYRLNDSRIRRIQLNLASDQDFSTALRVLESVYCPITHAHPRESTQPSAFPNAFHSTSSIQYTGRPYTAPPPKQTPNPFIPPLPAPQPKPGAQKRPTSSRGRGDGSDSRPSTATMELPPLPTPTFSDAGGPRGSQPTSTLDVANALLPPARPSSSDHVLALGVSALHQLPPQQLATRSALAAATQPTEAPSLHDYAARPGDERERIVDEMILRCLRDDGFVTLCEDVERAWRRVGLGF